jgi:hypothetical protein
MGYTQQNQNKILRSVYLIALSALIAGFLYSQPKNVFGAFTDYDPEIDISLGLINYMYTPIDLESPTADLPEIGMGLYGGGYLGLKSPLFTFFFNTENIYTTYEAGLAFNRLGAGDLLISVPLVVDLSYRLSLFRRKKFALQPFAGTGVDMIGSNRDNTFVWQIHYLVNAGLEIRYVAWDNTTLKIKASYGIIFVDDLESGFMHFIKVRFPVPFIP